MNSKRDMLIKTISDYDKPTKPRFCRGGDWILRFLEEYHLVGLIDATEEQLQEFATKYNITPQTKNDTTHK